MNICLKLKVRLVFCYITSNNLLRILIKYRKNVIFSWEFLHGWDRAGALSELTHLFKTEMRPLDDFSP